MRQPKKIVESIATVMLVLSVIVNVVIAHKLTQLSKPAVVQTLRKGDLLPGFSAVNLNGKAEDITYSSDPRPTVIYAFSPSCKWCARNYDNLQHLIKEKSANYRFVAVSLSDEGLNNYVATHQLAIPIYTGLSEDVEKKYRLGVTPDTIVISPQGRVLGNWLGAYSGQQKSQVEEFFHVSLPGITAKPQAISDSDNVTER